MPETLKRITPDEVLKAYVEKGFLPVQDYFTDIDYGKKCVCGLSILLISDEITFDIIGEAEDQEPFIVAKMSEEGFDPMYLSGFIFGFDSKVGVFSEVEMNTGIRDGQAAWEAVKHLALPEEK